MYRIQFGKEGLTALLGSLFLRRSLWSSLRAPTQRWRSCSLSASIRTWCLVPGGFSSLVVTYNKIDIPTIHIHYWNLMRQPFKTVCSPEKA